MCSICLLQKERLSHAQTRALLSEEREKVVLVETEVRVLRKQLDREKAAFEHGYVRLTHKLNHLENCVQACNR